jgi:CelD/BcsL family acetyltransferase involved in cellulose biosynthesis/RimJ/RimL family protein N-acetyltransferase
MLAMTLAWTIASDADVDAALVHGMRRLWQRDGLRSPFASPSLLRLQAATPSEAIERVAFACASDADGEILACIPLYLHRDGSLRLLQYRGSDHAALLCDPRLGADDLAQGFVAAIDALKARTLFIDRLPPSGLMLAALRIALARLGWQASAFAATSNPCLRMPVDDGGAGVMRSMRSHRKFDYFERRLRREPGYAFEAIQGDAGLEDWIDAFCDAHDWSWSRTSTPSVYRDPLARQALLDRCRAWARDDVLVRFSIRLASGRPAFAICLLGADRLVYHHVTVSPAYARHSAGHVLLRLIGDWMAERNIPTLDFGVGEEDYKQRYSNGVDRLVRVYGSSSSWSSHAMRARLDRAIRSRPALQSLWDALVNRGLRGWLAQRVRNLRGRARTLRAVHLREPASTRLALVRDRLVAEQQVYFLASGRGEVADDGVRELRVFDVLRMLVREQALPDRARADYYRLRSEGWIPYGIVEGGEVLQVSWIGPDPWRYLPLSIGLRRGRTWCIRKCVTARSARGQGLYTRVLGSVLARLPPADEVIIYTQPWNLPSRWGILNAGFRKVGVLRTRRWIPHAGKIQFIADSPR